MKVFLKSTKGSKSKNKEGIFQSNHASIIDSYDDDELASYALIYTIRKAN